MSRVAKNRGLPSSGAVAGTASAGPLDRSTAKTGVATTALPRPALAGLMIVLCGAAAYSNSLTGPFVFDDTVNIRDNADIRHVWPIWASFIKTENGKTTVHSRPVVLASFALNYAFGGLDTRGYHVTNLTIHILAGLVLLGIVRRTLLLPRAGAFAAVSTPLALLAALIWTLHPLQTQAVTYIVQRYESLMGLFYLVTLYAAIRAATSPRPLPWSVVSIASCLLAMGCKEVAVSAPIIVFLYDRTFVTGSFREAWRQRRGLHASLAATWLVFIPLYLMYSGGNSRGPVHFAGFGLRITPLEYARSQPGVVVHYLRLCFWPQGQCIDYKWPIAQTTDAIVPPLLVIVALLALTLWCLVRRPATGFLGVWFFLILAPTSGFVPIADLAFEHRMYLPLAAVVVAVLVGGYEIFRRWSADQPAASPHGLRLPAVVAVVVVIALGVQTFIRNQVYRSTITLWQDTAQKAPNNTRAHCNLALAYDAAGDPRQALAELDKLSINYTGASASDVIEGMEIQCQRGLILQKVGRLAEAEADFREALNSAPAETDAKMLARLHGNLAASLVQLGQGVSAIPHFNQALRLAPDDGESRLNLAVLLASLGYLEAAKDQFRAAVRLSPAVAGGRVETNGRLMDARPLLQFLARAWGADPSEIVARPPDKARAEYEFGAALAQAHEHAAALEHFTAAGKLQPAAPWGPALRDAERKSRDALSRRDD